MGVQGWQRDPFSLHEDRWFSAGQPTRLVRDQGAESYDEPPSGELLPLPDSAAEVGPGQLRRVGSSRTVPAALGTLVSDFASPELARNWRYWTVLPPCLLTLALSVLAIIVGSISLAANRSGVGPAPSGASPSLLGWVLLEGAGLTVAGLAAIVVLYVAADQQASRRACALSGWAIAVSAYGWAVLIPFLSIWGP